MHRWKKRTAEAAHSEDGLRRSKGNPLPCVRSETGGHGFSHSTELMIKSVAFFSFQFATAGVNASEKEEDG